MKVAEPKILDQLQSELLKPAVVSYLTQSVEKEVRSALAKPKDEKRSAHRLLEDERRKLRNLIAAIEGGSTAAGALLKAISERELTIKHLEAQVKREQEQHKQAPKKLPELSPWIREQLENLTALLKSEPARVKSEFRRLNLHLTFNPTEAKPRPHYIVNGQCDLFALAVSYLRVGTNKGAVLDSMRVQSVR
jgi:chromosome segregation ATPase